MSVGVPTPSQKTIRKLSSAFTDKYLPRKKPKPAPIEWMQQVQYLALVRAAKRKLVIGYHLHEGVWFAIALETDGDDVTTILGSHAHQALGKFKTQDAARLACEKFAKNWCGLPGMSKCECGPIGAVPPAPPSFHNCRHRWQEMQDRDGRYWLCKGCALARFESSSSEARGGYIYRPKSR